MYRLTGGTPLFIAVNQQRPEAVRMLLDAGGSLTLSSFDGSPLIKALQRLGAVCMQTDDVIREAHEGIAKCRQQYGALQREKQRLTAIIQKGDAAAAAAAAAAASPEGESSNISPATTPTNDPNASSAPLSAAAAERAAVLQQLQDVEKEIQSVETEYMRLSVVARTDPTVDGNDKAKPWGVGACEWWGSLVDGSPQPPPEDEDEDEEAEEEEKAEPEEEEEDGEGEGEPVEGDVTAARGEDDAEEGQETEQGNASTASSATTDTTSASSSDAAASTAEDASDQSSSSYHSEKKSKKQKKQKKQKEQREVLPPHLRRHYWTPDYEEPEYMNVDSSLEFQSLYATPLPRQEEEGEGGEGGGDQGEQQQQRRRLQQERAHGVQGGDVEGEVKQLLTSSLDTPRPPLASPTSSHPSSSSTTFSSTTTSSPDDVTAALAARPADELWGGQPPCVCPNIWSKELHPASNLFLISAAFSINRILEHIPVRRTDKEMIMASRNGSAKQAIDELNKPLYRRTVCRECAGIVRDASAEDALRKSGTDAWDIFDMLMRERDYRMRVTKRRERLERAGAIAPRNTDGTPSIITRYKGDDKDELYPSPEFGPPFTEDSLPTDSIFTTNSRGLPVLSYATRTKCVKAALALLTAGADVRHVARSGTNLLEDSFVSKRRFGVLQMEMLEHPYAWVWQRGLSRWNMRRKAALAYVDEVKQRIEQMQQQQQQLLLSPTATTTSSCDTHSHSAESLKQLQNELVKAQANVPPEFPSFPFPTESDKLFLYIYLLYGADPRLMLTNGFSPLTTLSTSGPLLVNSLLEQGVDVDGDDRAYTEKVLKEKLHYTDGALFNSFFAMLFYLMSSPNYFLFVLILA